MTHTETMAIVSIKWGLCPIDTGILMNYAVSIKKCWCTSNYISCILEDVVLKENESTTYNVHIWWPGSLCRRLALAPYISNLVSLPLPRYFWSMAPVGHFHIMMPSASLQLLSITLNSARQRTGAEIMGLLSEMGRVLCLLCSCSSGTK